MLYLLPTFRPTFIEQETSWLQLQNIIDLLQYQKLLFSSVPQRKQHCLYNKVARFVR